MGRRQRLILLAGIASIVGFAFFSYAFAVSGEARPRHVDSAPSSAQITGSLSTKPTAARLSASRALEAPLPTVDIRTPTPSVQPTPTARPDGTPFKVGIQVGHWKSNELPEELARLRTSTGTRAGGYTEVQVNLDIAQRVKAQLEAQGIIVDLLPATVPPSYDADAFVTIHADGSSSTTNRGFKLATPWRTSRAAQHLLDATTDEYAKATGMPQDGAITMNMRGYYAFNNRRHIYAIAQTTPAIIVEMGFLTNPTDRALMTRQPNRIAGGIANGIVRYLNEHDRNDGASLLPPSFKNQRPASEAGLTIFSAPNEKSRIVGRVSASSRISIFQERDGWYQGFAREGEKRLVGWFRKSDVVETNEPTPTPLPATDS